MTGRRVESAGGAPQRRRVESAGGAPQRLIWPLATLLIFAALVAANPVGFRGGGGDDWQYLQAARCWAAEGAPCVPQDHWWGRWPLVAPLGGLIALLGETRFALALVPLGATLTCADLLAHLGNRLFGAPAGWLAAMLFLTAPVVLFEALDPAVGTLELAAILGGAALIVRAGQSQRRRDWLLAGLAFGLAFQVRETSLATLPAAAFALWLLSKRTLPAALVFAAGFLAPLVVELLVMGLATGDPLFRRGLSLAHSGIASSEIANAASAGASPLFNPALIAGWEHETGIHLHWLVDGALDVLLNEKGGWTLLLALLAFAIGRRRLDPRKARLVEALLAAGILHGLILIFVFSIDPKPRMMLVPLAAAALALAPLLLALPRPWLGVTALARLAALLLGFLFVPRMGEGEAAARAWLAMLPAGSVETAEATRRRLGLVPEVQALPLADGTRPLLLVRTRDACDRAEILDLAPDALRGLAFARLGNANPLNGRQAALCLYRYASPAAARAFAAAHDETSPFTEESAAASRSLR